MNTIYLIFVSVLICITKNFCVGNSEAKLIWDAQKYAAHNSNQFRHAAKELYKLELKGHESVIDFGCRTGSISGYVAQYLVPNGLVYGVDSSLPMIKKAQESYSSINNLSFAVTDWSIVPVVEKFDVALAFWTLPWQKNYKNALQTIEKTLKPGGKALIAHIVDKGTLLMEYIERGMKMSPWNNYSPNYKFPMQIPSFEVVIDALRNTDFRIVHLEIKENSDYHKNRNDLLTNYLAGPFINCIPIEKRETFLNEAISAYLQEEPAFADGTIRDHAPVIVMVLEKK